MEDSKKTPLLDFSAIILELNDPKKFDVKKPVTEIEAMADVGFLDKNDFDHIYIQTPSGPKTFNSQYGFAASVEFLKLLQEAKFMERNNVATVDDVCKKMSEMGIFVDKEFMENFFGDEMDQTIRTRESSLKSKIGKFKKFILATNGLLNEIDQSESKTVRSIMNAPHELSAKEQHRRNETKKIKEHEELDRQTRRIHDTPNQPNTPGYYNEDKYNEHGDGETFDESQRFKTQDTFSVEGLTGQSYDDNSIAAKLEADKIYATELYNAKVKEADTERQAKETAARETYEEQKSQYQAEQSSLQAEKESYEKYIEELNRKNGIQTEPSYEVSGFSEQTTVYSPEPTDKYAYVESIYSSDIPDKIKQEYRDAFAAISEIDKKIETVSESISQAESSYEEQMEKIKNAHEFKVETFQTNFDHFEESQRINAEFAQQQREYHAEQSALKSEKTSYEQQIADLNTRCGVTQEQFQSFISSPTEETIKSIVSSPEAVSQYKALAESISVIESKIQQSEETYQKHRSDYTEKFQTCESNHTSSLNAIGQRFTEKNLETEDKFHAKETKSDFDSFKEKVKQNEYTQIGQMVNEIRVATGYNISGHQEQNESFKTDLAAASSAIAKIDKVNEMAASAGISFGNSIGSLNTSSTSTASTTKEAEGAYSNNTQSPTSALFKKPSAESVMNVMSSIDEITRKNGVAAASQLAAISEKIKGDTVESVILKNQGMTTANTFGTVFSGVGSINSIDDINAFAENRRRENATSTSQNSSTSQEPSSQKAISGTKGSGSKTTDTGKVDNTKSENTTTDGAKTKSAKDASSTRSAEFAKSINDAKTAGPQSFKELVNVQQNVMNSINATKVQALDGLNLAERTNINNKVGNHATDQSSSTFPSYEVVHSKLHDAMHKVSPHIGSVVEFADKYADRFGRISGLNRDETFSALMFAKDVAQPALMLSAQAAAAVVSLSKANTMFASIEFDVLKDAYAPNYKKFQEGALNTEIQGIKDSYSVTANGVTRADTLVNKLKNGYGLGNISNENIRKMLNFSAEDLKKMSTMTFEEAKKAFNLNMSMQEFEAIRRTGVLNMSVENLNQMKGELNSSLNLKNNAQNKVLAGKMKPAMSDSLENMLGKFGNKYGIHNPSISDLNKLHKDLLKQLESKTITGDQLKAKKEMLQEVKALMAFSKKANALAILKQVKTKILSVSKDSVKSLAAGKMLSRDGVDRDFFNAYTKFRQLKVTSRFKSLTNALRFRQNLRLKRIDKLRTISARIDPAQFSKRQIKRAAKAGKKLEKLSTKRLTQRALNNLNKRTLRQAAIRKLSNRLSKKISTKLTSKLTGKITAKIGQFGAKLATKAIGAIGEKFAGSALIAAGPWAWLAALIIVLILCCCLCICSSGVSYSTYTTVDAFQLTAYHKTTNDPTKSLAARTMAYLDTVYEAHYEDFIWKGVNDYMGEDTDLAKNGITKSFVFEDVTYVPGKVTVVETKEEGGKTVLDLPDIIYKYVFVQDATSIYYNDSSDTMTSLFAGKSLSLTNKKDEFTLLKKNDAEIFDNEMHNRIYNEKEIIAMTSISFANDLVVDTSGTLSSRFDDTIADNFEQYAFTLWLTSHYCIIETDENIAKDEGKSSKNWWQKAWTTLFGGGSSSETTDAQLAVEKKFADTEHIRLADLTGVWELTDDPKKEIINKIVPLNQNAFFPSAGHGIGTAISQEDTEYAKKLKTAISNLSKSYDYVTFTGKWSEEEVHKEVVIDLDAVTAKPSEETLKAKDSIFTIDIKTAYEYSNYAYAYIGPQMGSVGTGTNFQYNSNNKLDQIYAAAQAAGDAKKAQYDAAWTKYQEEMHEYHIGERTTMPSQPSITMQNVIDAYNSWIDDVAAVNVADYVGNTGNYIIRKDTANGYVFNSKEDAIKEAENIITEIYKIVEGKNYFYCTSLDKTGSNSRGYESGSNLANDTMCGVATIPKTSDYIDLATAKAYATNYYKDSSNLFKIKVRNTLYVSNYKYGNYAYASSGTTGNNRLTDQLGTTEVFNWYINFGTSSASFGGSTPTLYKRATGSGTHGSLANYTSVKYSWSEYYYPVTNKTSSSNYVKSTALNDLFDLTDHNSNKKLYFAKKEFYVIDYYEPNCGKEVHEKHTGNSTTGGGCYGSANRNNCTWSGGYSYSYNSYCGACSKLKTVYVYEYETYCGSTATRYYASGCSHLTSGSTKSGYHCSQGEITSYSRNCGKEIHKHKTASGSEVTAAKQTTKGGCYTKPHYKLDSYMALIAIRNGVVCELKTASGLTASSSLKNAINDLKHAETVYYEITDFYQNGLTYVQLNYTMPTPEYTYIMPFFDEGLVGSIKTDPKVSAGSVTPTYITFQDLYKHFFICGGHTQLVVQPVILNFVGPTTMFDTDLVCQQLAAAEEAGSEDEWTWPWTPSAPVSEKYASILGCTLPSKSYLTSSDAGIWEIRTAVGRENIVNAVNMVGNNWEQQYRFKYSGISQSCDSAVDGSKKLKVDSTRAILIDPLSYSMAPTKEAWDNDPIYKNFKYKNSSTVVPSIETMMEKVYNSLIKSEAANGYDIDLDDDKKVNNLDYEAAVNQKASAELQKRILSAIDRADRCQVAMGLIGKVGYTQAAHNYVSQSPLKYYWSLNSNKNPTFTYYPNGNNKPGVQITVSDLLGMGDSYDYGLLYATDCSGFASYMMGIDKNIISTAVDSFTVDLPIKKELLESMDFDASSTSKIEASWKDFNPTIKAIYEKAIQKSPDSYGNYAYSLEFKSAEITSYSKLMPGDIVYRGTGDGYSGHALVFIASDGTYYYFAECTTSGSNSSKIGPGTIAIKRTTASKLAEDHYTRYYDVDFDLRKINFRIIY